MRLSPQDVKTVKCVLLLVAATFAVMVLCACAPNRPGEVWPFGDPWPTDNAIPGSPTCLDGCVVQLRFPRRRSK